MKKKKDFTTGNTYPTSSTLKVSFYTKMMAKENWKDNVYVKL